MYHIHTTKALVVGITTTGEGNCFISLFTHEFGMIRAKAQSLRAVSSKMRFALQEYSFVEVSLVRGKDVWRVTNALPVFNLYFELKDQQNIFIPIAKMILLIRRMSPEEGHEGRIFDDIFEISRRATKKEYNEMGIKTIEWIFVLRVLYFLGYARNLNFSDICGDSFDWSREKLVSYESQKTEAVKVINSALEASQL